MAAIKNMTVGSPAKLILTFALPLTVGNIFQQLYVVVDSAVVGQALGVAALAAIGTIEWFNWMALGLVQGFANGFGILQSQKFGAQDDKGLRKVVGNSIVLAIVLAVVLLVGMELLVEPALNILHVPMDIRYMSRIYLRVMYGGIPIMMAYNALASILRALGDSRSPLIAMIIAALSNIGLDLLFVLVFHWGVAGAAIATLLGQLISAIYCGIVVSKITILKLARSDFKPEAALIRRLLILGMPMAFQNVVISVGGMVLQTIVNGFGVLFIAGMTATNKLYGILEIAATSYGFAVVTFTGQNLGAGKYGRIRQGVRAGLVIGIITSALIMLVMVVFGRQILGMFLSGTEAEVASAMGTGYRYLVIMSVCLPILYILHVIRSCIQGIGNTVLPMGSGLAEFVARTICAFTLPMLLGQNGIFWAEPLAWLAADVELVISYFVLMRKYPKK